MEGDVQARVARRSLRPSPNRDKSCPEVNFAREGVTNFAAGGCFCTENGMRTLISIAALLIGGGLVTPTYASGEPASTPALPTRPVEALRLLRARNFAPLTQAIEQGQAAVERDIRQERELAVVVDSFDNSDPKLTPLIDELARRGVRRASASFLFLRTGIKLPADLAWGGWTAKEMKRLYTHKVEEYGGGGKITLPSPLYRQARYNEIKAQAALRGIAFRLCRCKNSDMTEDCCHGDLPETEKYGQMTLF
jgi:hypothetical protein